MFSAVAPQYWHRWPSRANTARRLSAARVRNGTFTKYVRRMTDGSGKATRSEWSALLVWWTTSAFSLSTRMIARRVDTTHSGS